MSRRRRCGGTRHIPGASRRSLANPPALHGRSPILVNNSSSRTTRDFPATSTLSQLKAAAVFCVAFACPVAGAAITDGRCAPTGRRDGHGHVVWLAACRKAAKCWRYYGYFDAHHDSGYRQSFADYQATGRFSCEDWTYPHHEAGARITVRYPGWQTRWADQESSHGIPIDRCTDDGQPVPGVSTDVFACLSGGWVPAWCDDQWQQFIDAFPGQAAASIPI